MLKMDINKELSLIEDYAKDNYVPIMLKDGIEYLCNYIKDNNIKNILEVGSAIGYSAIKMALVSEDITITTIEKDEDRYNMAVDNIRKFNLDKRINIILGNAKEVELTDKYDLIFIDASKGNNIYFFEKFTNNLTEDGVIITDNLSFHGRVEDASLITSKNQLGIVKKIKTFIEYLDNNKEFTTTYVSVGDKIAISKKNN